MPSIVRLLGGLYGLDIASKLFEEHFSKTLTTMGLKRLISDPQVFRLDKDGDFCLLSTFVDDALAAASPGTPLRLCGERIGADIQDHDSEGSSYSSRSQTHSGSGTQIINSFPTTVYCRLVDTFSS